MQRLRSILPVLVLLITACGGGDGSITEPDVELPAGSMSARIDGAEWRASLGLSVGSSGGILAFAGNNGSVTIGMAVGILNGPGTYPIGTTGAPSNLLITENSGRTWHAFSQNGTGSVTITALTANSATGTFTVTAPAVTSSGATGNRVITQGAFNLKF